MPVVVNAAGFEAIVSFVVWSIVAMTAARAIFGSFVAKELRYYYATHGGEARKEAIRRLDWEVRNKCLYDQDVVDKHPHAAKREIPPAILENKKELLRSLVRGTTWSRAGTFFASCMMCQTFWISLAWVGVTAAGVSPGAIIASALAYAGGATIINRLIFDRPAAAGTKGATCTRCAQ